MGLPLKKKSASAEKTPAKKKPVGKPKLTLVKSNTSKPVAKVKKPIAKSTAPAKKIVKSATKKPVAGGVKVIKNLFNKSTLTTHLSEDSGVERRDVAKVLTSLESTIAGSLHTRGAGEFLMPGMFKIVTKQIPARKVPAIKKGTMVKNPFNGGKEEPHKGRPASVKPASVRVKIRPLKKLKDAAA